MNEQNQKSCLFHVNCSWDIVNDKQLIDAINVCTTPTEKTKDLENVVTLQTCLHLCTKSKSVPCILDLRTEKLKIKELMIVSEARIIEIYGKCEEYVLTSHGEFFDECQDLMVYITEVKLPESSHECAIKFTRLKDNEQMWLFGIHIYAENCTSFSPQNTINFQNVNSILKESGHQLSEKAEQCKKFLQTYGSYWDQSKLQKRPQNPQNLIKMFETKYLSQCGDLGSQAKVVTKCLSEMIPLFSQRQKEKFESSLSKPGSTKPSSVVHSHKDVAVQHESEETVSESLKEYITDQCNSMERRILSQVQLKLEQLEKKQNEKLDKILYLLSSISIKR